MRDPAAVQQPQHQNENPLLPPDWRSLDDAARDALIDDLIDDYAGRDRATRIAALVALGVTHAEADAALAEIDDDIHEMREADRLASL